MSRFQRLVVAFVLACVPWLAHAQAHKCRQADGSISFQDHPCPPVAASGAESADETVDIGLPPLSELDAPCQLTVNHAVSTCLLPVKDRLDRCYKSRLSSACSRKMIAGTARQDPVCVKQAAPCVQEGVVETRRCVVNALPPTCVAQLRTAGLR